MADEFEFSLQLRKKQQNETNTFTLEYQAKEDTRPIFQFFDTNTSIISAVWAIISANDFGN